MGYAWFNLVVIIVAIVWMGYYHFVLKDQDKNTIESDGLDILDGQNKIKLFTADELRKYDGTGDSKVYLSIMGQVFDVERGKQHYGPEMPYAAFAGKDASRAFITGVEKEIEGKKSSEDHVLSLSPAELVSLDKWKAFYDENYDLVGRLIGRFYEETGEPTEYYHQIHKKIQFGLKQQEEEKNFNTDFPPCNVEYKPKQGTRVWCTTQSGGIEREWAGFPVQFFNQETKSFSCVCAQKESFDLPQLRQYDNCDEKTLSCLVQTNDEQQGNDD